jgi:predicted MFS family arabinose efflux permease
MTARPVSVPVFFLVFAVSYVFSALLRAVTATLAPVFSAELGLQAGGLGLLAGAYFFGFAALQLPLGKALDRHGPRRTLAALIVVAALGCAAFAVASSIAALIAARVLIGAGMAAGLMAALTAFRQHLSPSAQLRANSWMLMTGSLGMLASTLPVQLLLPALGWRGLFWVLATLLLLSAALVRGYGPADMLRADAATVPAVGYRDIVRHPLFMRMAPLAFVLYGGLIAVQSLWAGPWLTRVAAWTPVQAAQGLFAINLSMLCAFAAWGALMPRLARRGVLPLQLMAWGLPVALLALAANVALGSRAVAAHWAFWCVACTFVSFSQPAVGAAFPASQAGRALSAFNLIIFSGVFCVQWGLGLLIDLLRGQGWPDDSAFRGAFAAFGICAAAAYGWFLWCGRQAADNSH